MTAGPDYGWAKQAELVRAYECVVGKEGAFDKSKLSRAVKDREIKSNGLPRHACLVDVNSFKAWIAKDQDLDNTEIRQLGPVDTNRAAC
ncbi:MAG: hypothetical protein BWY09_03157 [Candidatus Hydrogenedentes bacterium ADurb.Bin179]|nr:MAG: hypothetical protein BWY09_03157 [Candidatus Hydrogenedentes bacterium ADurb.Bin179]